MLPVSIYPYMNLEDLNLDYILKKLMKLETDVQDFVEMNAIKYADPIQWNITTQYEKNTIVIDPATGSAYLSVRPVPAGIDISRTEYWTEVFNLSALIQDAVRNLTEHDAGISTVATFASAPGEWIMWKDILYVATSQITPGDAYTVGGNIARLTVEEAIKDFAALIDQNAEAIAAEAETRAREIESVTDGLTALSGRTDAIEEEIAALQYAGVYATPEAFGAVGDGVADDTDAIQAAINTGRGIFLEKKYKTTKALFVPAPCNIIGSAESELILAHDTTSQFMNYNFGLIFGASAFGTPGVGYSGIVAGVHVRATGGVFNYVFGFIKASNVHVIACTFNFENAAAECRNKVVFFGDNEDVLGATDATRYNCNVINCEFSFPDSDVTTIDQCESMSAARSEYVTFRGNVVKFGRDDIGIHGCKNVTIVDNVLLAVSARIYCANSQFVTIANNKIEMHYVPSMGIHIESEVTSVSGPSFGRPQQIAIVGNLIDCTGVTPNDVWSGLRVSSAKRVTIANNVLSANNLLIGNIYIEAQADSTSPSGYWVPEDIEVTGNVASGLVCVYPGQSSQYAPDRGVHAHGNSVFGRYASGVAGNIFEHNRLLTASLINMDYGAYVPYNVRFGLTNGATAATNAQLQYNGIARYREEFAGKIHRKMRFEASASGSYTITLKKGGTTIGTATRSASGPFNMTLSDDAIAPDDVLTAEVNSVPANAFVSLSLKVIKFKYDEN